MSITERTMALGEFAVTLNAATPLTVRSQLDFFGHILITKTHVDPDALGDTNMKAAAIYAGVVRAEEDRFRVLSGSGMAFWLGDEDGKGRVIETAVTQTTATLSTWVTALVNTSDLTVGTVTNTGTTATASYQYLTPRAALDAVTDLVGAEWRVNPDGTVDAAAQATLFQSGKAMAVKLGSSGDFNIAGLQAADIGRKQDVYDYTIKTLLVAQGEGSTAPTGSATAATSYKNFKGNTPVFTRVVDGSNIDPANATSAAQSTLNLFSGVKREISLSTDTYALTRKVKAGDSIYVYDAALGLVDNTVEIAYQGQLLHPILLRVYAITWPLERGMGVYFRDLNGNYTDLTGWVSWETGATTLEVGSASRTLDTSGSSTSAVQGRISQPVQDSGTAVVTTDGAGNGAVVFPTAFPSTPIVMLTNGDGTASGGHPSIVSRSTTGFTFRWHINGAAVAGAIVRCDWFATT